MNDIPKISDSSPLEKDRGSPKKQITDLFQAAVTSIVTHESDLSSVRWNNRFRYVENDAEGQAEIQILRRTYATGTSRIGRITHEGYQNDDGAKASLEDFYGSEKLSIEHVLAIMLKEGDATELAKAALALDVPALYSEPREQLGFRRRIFNTFASGNKEDLEVFLTELENSEDEAVDASINLNKKKITKLINVEVRQWLKAGKTDSAHRLLDMLDSHGLIQVSELNDVISMTDPKVAGILASHAVDEDIFGDMKPQARLNMANLLLVSVLDSFASSHDRHQQNSQLIKRKLFDSSSYKKVLHMKDLLLLANAFTTRLTQDSRSKQDLLPTDGQGTHMLVNCGEAVFRILSITTTDPSQVEENRNYAELFDALMTPYYKEFEKSKIITVADICARYPEAKEDVVLELQAIASRDGFSAASNYYRELKAAHDGSHVANRKYKPGYGVIS